ncbi:DUF4249 domain-containing protein [Telluribacter sp. SYSU D00476]|uniref:DUF4249 domain-containing protein n=1 Tax=Telluribacter sp. SYSU D00476 TaxID=2811430 RepID=UPI001FF2CE1A|nr:DUF4249 domain-containing protein [Telluribacter sp. SYSU D00476]
MHHKVLHKSLLFLLVAYLSGCVEEVRVPIRTTEPQLVVEGRITSARGPYTVRLSRSGNYNSPGSYEGSAITDARVQILETTTDRRVDLLPVDEQPGLYQSQDSTFVARAGQSYRVRIELPDGKVFVSEPETMPEPVPVESLTARFTSISARPNDTPFGYEIYLNTQDQPGQRNYYRWTARSVIRRESIGVRDFGGNYNHKFCWTPVFDNMISIYADTYSDGQPVREQYVYRSPVYIVGKHFVEVQQYSLTREAYQYWRRFNEQRQRIGTIFDPIPSPVYGNVYNAADPTERALGVFEVAGVSQKRLVVPGDTISDAYLKIQTFRYVIPGDCRLVFYQGDEMPPLNWLGQ